MVMQTLRLIGVTVAGFEYLEEFGPRCGNPKGFWDLPTDVYVNGIQDNRYEGQGVKVLGYWLNQTNPAFVSKVIHCLRDRSESVASMRRMFELSKDQRTGLVTPEYTVDVNAQGAEQFVSRFDGPVLEVQYEFVTSDPAREVCRIAKFLGLESRNLGKAIANIDRRKVWQSEQQ